MSETDTRKIWVTRNGTKVELEEDWEFEGSGWYAKDFLEFIAATLADVYPELRPLVKWAMKKCWAAWTEREGKEPYLPNVSKERYSRALAYYFGDVRRRANELIRRLADGSVYDVGD